MDINWSARLENKTFWVSMIGMVILLGKQLGIDLTQYIPSNYTEIITTIFIILGMLGIVVDTSTTGIGDVAKVTENVVQATNTEEKVQVTASTTEINNTVSSTSASSKVVVDNPDNIQSIGATVNVTNAVSPQ